MKRTYDVYGYHSYKDYLQYNPVIIDEGLTRKWDALTIGKEAYTDKNYNVYPIVKVQSSDREFIHLFGIENFEPR